MASPEVKGLWPYLHGCHVTGSALDFGVPLQWALIPFPSVTHSNLCRDNQSYSPIDSPGLPSNGVRTLTCQQKIRPAADKSERGIYIPVRLTFRYTFSSDHPYLHVSFTIWILENDLKLFLQESKILENDLKNLSCLVAIYFLSQREMKCEEEN